MNDPESWLQVETMIFDSHLFPTHKKDYIQGVRPQVDCILCAIIEGSKEVSCLKIAETESVLVSVNLYPYNSGHIMIFPRKHTQDLRELNETEEKDIVRLTRIFLDILDENYHPTGYNIGYNLGKNAGASIEHIHQHIIPRYPNELGVIDLIGGAKINIESPIETQLKLKNTIMEYCSRNSIKDIHFSC